MNDPTELGLVSLNMNHDSSTAIHDITELAGRTFSNLIPRKIARYESPVQDAPAHSPLDKMFFDLPLELLVEIATYLRPLDIVRLARVNKVVRGLLMRRSAACIWRTSLRTANALPPTPTELPEPLLVALLFLAECTICGRYTDDDVDFFLQAKLCSECQGTDLIPAGDTGFAKLLYVSTSKDKSLGLVSLCLRNDYKRIKSKHEALQATRDAKALQVWTKQQIKLVENRTKSARLLSKWFKTWTKNRPVNERLSRRERRQRTSARVADVEARLSGMGYQYSEVRLLRTLRAKNWREWVANSGPLDEQAWEILLPHLLHHLEEGRKRLRCSVRQPALDAVLFRIQDRLKPISCIQPLDTENWAMLSTSNSGSFIPEPSNNFTISADKDAILPSFPHNTDVLVICAEVRAVMEAQTPGETFEFEIQTKDAEIEHAAQAWRDVLELTLLNLLPTDTRPAEIGAPDYKLILGTDRDARPLDLLSVECRKLLRADSIFCLKPKFMNSNKELLYYPKNFQGQFKMSNRVNLQCHSVGTRIARALLCAMGCPDASYIAMSTITRLYQCGRCDDKPIFYLWDELLQHYMKKSRENQMTTFDIGCWPQAPEVTDLDMTMHEVDSVYPGKPLVQLVDASAYIPALTPVLSPNYTVCLLCLQANSPAYVGADNIQDHFQNVHTVGKSIEGVHYTRDTANLMSICL
ncbi:hypothetical protein RSOL_075960 [Rhizoctonia solani AG-3 Rhs1AP]|uniref:F-box domain-containing protein n=1 Tax=Rhizoctonia solani AG-3 Rhs1AP TaxID=1086054 RepID=X8J0R3_9AGAM|nr:hypothetical protein RSOL_075960 [Rhizoctonia solani AG-3 Rhs1AP]